MQGVRERFSGVRAHYTIAAIGGAIRPPDGKLGAHQQVPEGTHGSEALTVGGVVGLNESLLRLGVELA